MELATSIVVDRKSRSWVVMDTKMAADFVHLLHTVQIQLVAQNQAVLDEKALASNDSTHLDRKDTMRSYLVKAACSSSTTQRKHLFIQPIHEI